MVGSNQVTLGPGLNWCLRAHKNIQVIMYERRLGFYWVELKEVLRHKFDPLVVKAQCFASSKQCAAPMVFGGMDMYAAANMDSIPKQKLSSSDNAPAHSGTDEIKDHEMKGTSNGFDLSSIIDANFKKDCRHS